MEHPSPNVPPPSSRSPNAFASPDDWPERKPEAQLLGGNHPSHCSISAVSLQVSRCDGMCEEVACHPSFESEAARKARDTSLGGACHREGQSWTGRCHTRPTKQLTRRLGDLALFTRPRSHGQQQSPAWHGQWPKTPTELAYFRLAMACPCELRKLRQPLSRATSPAKSCAATKGRRPRSQATGVRVVIKEAQSDAAKAVSDATTMTSTP